MKSDPRPGKTVRPFEAIARHVREVGSVPRSEQEWLVGEVERLQAQIRDLDGDPLACPECHGRGDTPCDYGTCITCRGTGDCLIRVLWSRMNEH